MKKATNSILSVLIILFLFVSVAMFVIPEADEQLYKAEQNRIIDEYENTIISSNNKISGTKPFSNVSKGHITKEKPVCEKIDFKRLKADIKRYNKQLFRERQMNFSSTSSFQEAPINLYNYGFSNSVYGYLDIDKIDLKIALYLGASEYNMSIGAACLSQTSIPYGGANTNSVIAGHCGYGGRQYFRYIDRLAQGDSVKVTTPFGTREYRVIEKKKIIPNDTSSILIQEGRDLITLFTCYPYPTSDYRMCVFCEAVPPRDNERK